MSSNSHRTLLRALASSKYRKCYYSIAGIVAAAAVIRSVYMCATAQRRSGDRREDEAIDFADPLEVRFKAYMKQVNATHGDLLHALVADLEKLGQEREALRTSEAPEDMEEKAAKLAELDAQVEACAVHADEVLTQYICRLDGVPVGQGEELKQRRKELVNNAASIAPRISLYLKSSAQ